MRLRWLAAAVLAVVVGGLVQAQPPAAPTLEVRLRSVNDLLDKAVYIGRLAGKEDIVLGVKQLLKNLSTEGKGIEGVDAKRPFGVYATLDKDVVNSSFTVMVPIADQERFLQMLKERLEIVPEKADGGTLKVKLPDQAANPVIDAVYLRFTNDYLYVGRSAKDLDAKSLIAPKVYFANDDGAVASVLVRMDRIPNEVKTFVIGQLELALAEQRKMMGAADPAEKAGFEFAAEVFTGGMVALLDDTKEVSARLFIDEKTDEFTIDATLTPKPGTASAKYIASLAGQSSLSAGIVGGKDTVARGSAKLVMPDEMKKQFGKLVDTAIAEIAKKANNDQERDLIKKVTNTLAPTLKATELDLAATLTGPDAKGHYALLAAVAVKNGKEIEKLIKEFAPFLQQGADITFDVEKVGGFTLHKVAVKELPPEMERIIGTKTVWLAISDTHIALSLEPDGTAIRAGLKAPPAQVPVLNVELSAAKLLPLVGQDLPADKIRMALKETFGDSSPAGKDTITVTVTGGDKLNAKAKMKGKVVQLIFSTGVIDR